MAKRKIISVGLQLPSDDVEYLKFFPNQQSLLDADIIIFRPYHFVHSIREHNGKYLLDETDSFSLKQTIEHWKLELETAFNSGKTIVVLLSKFEEFFIYTGERQVSGTGRNAKTTNIVAKMSTYDALPVFFKSIVSKSGSQILVTKDAKFLGAYWGEFSKLSSYQSYFDGDFSKILLTTKTGGKAVGATINDKGTILLLPDVYFNALDEEAEPNEDGWTENEIIYGQRFLNHVIELDKYLRASAEASIQPSWVQDENFDLKEETQTKNAITQTEKELAELQVKLTELETKLTLEGSLRRLLYEQGPELEDAIIEALKLLGFAVERYQDDQSEFDSVFMSAEGRFLGEAEGKDNKPINIDKLSQLERNIQEDVQREDVDDYAKGVLFGNAYRLTSLLERSDFFTTKCIQGAKRSKIALVRTPDLFFVARYLKENPDEEYARLCREAMSSTEGAIVQFPTIPEN